MSSKKDNEGTDAQDVKRGWLNPIRAVQAACTSNKGYGIVQLTVVVKKNEPVFWLEPELKKVHPAALGGATFSPTLLGLLIAAAELVDNKENDTVE